MLAFAGQPQTNVGCAGHALELIVQIEDHVLREFANLTEARLGQRPRRFSTSIQRRGHRQRGQQADQRDADCRNAPGSARHELAGAVGPVIADRGQRALFQPAREVRGQGRDTRVAIGAAGGGGHAHNGRQFVNFRRAFCRQQLTQHDPKRVHVIRNHGRLAGEALRTRIGTCKPFRTRRIDDVLDACDAEVDQLGTPAGRHEHIGRLDIAMQHEILMSMRYRLAHLDHQRYAFARV